MTLRNLLIDKMAEHTTNAMRNVLGNTDTFNEYYGRAKMCDELIKLLSEETLQTEVVTKEEALARKTTDTVEVTEKGIAW